MDAQLGAMKPRPVPFPFPLPPDYFAPPAPGHGHPAHLPLPPPPPRRPPGPLTLRRNPDASSLEAREGPTTSVWFRLGTRFVCALASPIDGGVHKNVARLRPGRLSLAQQQLVRAVVDRLLPAAARAWFDAAFPEWDLPPRLVLKARKPGWDDEFAAEKAAYARLRPLQGVVIPRCFGEVRCVGAGAGAGGLLLSDIGGASLATPAGALLDPPDLRRMLRQALDALGRFRVQQDDVKLDNFHVVGGGGDRIMALDLETLRDEYPADDDGDALLAGDIDAAVDTLSRRYEDNQYCFWEDGLIAVGEQG